MPSPNTFSIGPIASLIKRWQVGGMVSVDPFARNAKAATYTNDLDPACDTTHHMEAGEFCAALALEGVQPDLVFFDPPYSPRQISECYKKVGLAVGMAETQNAALYKRVKDGLDALCRSGTVAICCGWNSAGLGKTRGWEMVEILLVAHGGAHNDTIVTVERKL
jgi:hypothetical protein